VGVREDVTEEQQTQRDGLVAVGSRLAKAREQQQRSVESVASDLHLRLEVVRAIENGDEAQLPAATFLRGYVKAYARLLEIDDAALVAQLPAAAVHNPEPLKRVGMRRRTGVSFPAGKWFIWGLVLAGLVFLVVFGAPVLERLWTSTGSSEVASDHLQLPQAEPFEEENQSGLLALPETPLPIEHGRVEQEAVEQEAVEQEIVEREAVEQETVEREAVEQETVEQETVATPEPESVAQPIAEQIAVEKPLEPEPVTQETAGPALIQMRFSEDSWVEMESHGRKLVVGTQYAGSERTVRAKPPIQILLGNAPGVELVYRGEVVDITPYQRGKVARLTLED
jgi:cytoskeleton protein RodZ